MSTILITGASGFIGQALAQSLAQNHQVICMSRRNPRLELPWVRGSFDAFEDLRGLDKYAIDAVAHLAGVTGGGTEREQILVNVEGTRCLMRYLVDRGCAKFVMASSIAAVGMQSTAFRPLQLPLPDEHPCLDRNGYGFSKFLMEAITQYCWRQHEGIDVIDLRLSTVLADDALTAPRRVGPITEWALGSITIMARSDAVRAFTLALEAPHRPGVRIMNAVGPRAWVADPVAEVLRGWWGDEVDVSAFERAGHEYDSVFALDRISQELGFSAAVLPPHP
jgi:nucleoside-diphosphate-sugar epimerase